MFVTVSGMLTLIRDVQLLNALIPISVVELDRLAVTRLAQLKKQYPGIVVTPEGRVTSVIPDPSNVLDPRVVRLLGRANVLRLVHPLNADPLMVVRLAGNATFERLVSLRKQLFPIVVRADSPNPIANVSRLGISANRLFPK